MNVQKLILDKIPLFHNFKYYQVFSLLIKNTLKSKKEKQIHIINIKKLDKMILNNEIYADTNLSNNTKETQDSIKIKKESISIWNIIYKYINENEIFNGIEINKLVMNYLIYKSKVISKKINYLCNYYELNYNEVLTKYLYICKRFIENESTKKIILEKIKNLEYKKINILKMGKFSVSDRNKYVDEKNNYFKTKAILKNELRRIKNISDDEYNVSKQKTLRELLEGIDFEKYFEKNQISDIKNGNYTGAIIGEQYKNYIDNNIKKLDIHLNKNKKYKNSIIGQLNFHRIYRNKNNKSSFYNDTKSFNLTNSKTNINNKRNINSYLSYFKTNTRQKNAYLSYSKSAIKISGKLYKNISNNFSFLTKKESSLLTKLNETGSKIFNLSKTGTNDKNQYKINPKFLITKKNNCSNKLIKNCFLLNNKNIYIPPQNKNFNLGKYKFSNYIDKSDLYYQ